MNFIKFKYSLLLLLGVAVFTTSCFDDLDTVPLDPDEITAATVYDDPAAYKQVLAKVYAGLALSGQQGPAGQPDISGIDEGFSTYIRQYWKAQELTTDEAVIGWNDGTIKDYHDQDWDEQSEFVRAMYNRIFYQISLTNEFLRETTEEKLDERGETEATRNEVATFRAEARFMRALSYYHALDLFRSVPFVTDEDAVGAFFPEQISAQDLFTFIETELKEVETQLLAPRTNEYGRADQAAAWTLLAKLYLNASVYIEEDRSADAAEYAKKVIDAGYTLDPNYQKLFLADNDQAEGIIFPVLFDGVNSRTWGGMTFVVHAAVGGSMNVADYGIDFGWGGTRTTSALVNKFPSANSGSLLVEAVESGDYPLLGVPGGYQDWDPDNTTTTLAAVNGEGIGSSQYEGFIYMAEAGEFKFSTPGWAMNWGDSDGDGILEPGGDNLSVAEPGFYKMNVNLDTISMDYLSYSVVKTEWGIIGDATPGGWDSDTDMTYNPESGAWEITADLTKGELKFRPNNDWPGNFGDNSGDAILEVDGANIAIPSAGTYIIKLYIDKPDYTYSIELASFDGRAMFYTDGQTLEIADISQFTEGYAITKFKNITSTGQPGSDLTFVDTDFPMFRLADVYLMYAEALLRSGGSRADALTYVNLVRRRAYGGPGGDITDADLDLDFILDERARELYWECHRRTDLVRFGQFTDGSYVWPWKGAVPEGAATPGFRDVFPIPSSDIGANPNLTQNPGY